MLPIHLAMTRPDPVVVPTPATQETNPPSQKTGDVGPFSHPNPSSNMTSPTPRK